MVKRKRDDSGDSSAYLSQHSIHLSEPIVPVLAFSQLNLQPESLKAPLATFTAPTPIQACTWPPLLAGRDVVGIAETGSGKTLAFGIPALAHLHAKGSSDVLVVAPTRELAIQTHEALAPTGKQMSISSVCLYGGVPKDAQVKALKKASKKSCRVLVGTPGRILDLVADGVCDLSKVSYLVLDEADRMLDKGFENDIRKIISMTADISTRQTVMFSATWPESVRKLASEFMRNPVRVTVGAAELTANNKVEQVIDVFDDPRSKDSRLLAQLRAQQAPKKPSASSNGSRILIFALYKKEACRLESMLAGKGYAVGALHGDLSQVQRIAALDNFKSGKVSLLVATDVAARGLDIPNVTLVINYTFPLTIEDYVHRIGRTGRGGQSGKSVTFFTGENHERGLAGELMKVVREAGFEADGLKKFPMSVKKKEHSFYGAFYKAPVEGGTGPKKIRFV